MTSSQTTSRSARPRMKTQLSGQFATDSSGSSSNGNILFKIEIITFNDYYGFTETILLSLMQFALPGKKSNLQK